MYGFLLFALFYFSQAQTNCFAILVLNNVRFDCNITKIPSSQICAYPTTKFGVNAIAQGGLLAFVNDMTSPASPITTQATLAGPADTVSQLLWQGWYGYLAAGSSFNWQIALSCQKV
eukprot:TRINITY_DN2054_c0_g1_i1.p1 TRINITY_DN2054_c0_g1~~TRINITY_DN2054_c0_g1_i1.p1  ORF type:complete len:117 (-),score=8.98 TRINITY_DN2054_c0_g1_i1:42-392(-)